MRSGPVLLFWALAVHGFVGPGCRRLRTPLLLRDTPHTNDLLAFDDEGDVEGEASGLQLISNSVEHIKALQRNEQSLSFYKSFGTWNNEYVSAKVNKALNLEIATLSRIAASSTAKAAPRAAKRAKASKKGGADGKPRNFQPKRAADTISDDEVRSGLIALLTLYDLAHNSTSAADGSTSSGDNSSSSSSSSGGDSAAQTTTKWNNPESPEQLARFMREVEALGSGGGRGRAAELEGGSRGLGGLRVAGAKASWKQALRQSRREEAGAGTGQGQDDWRADAGLAGRSEDTGRDQDALGTPAWAGEGGLDVDRIVINDLAGSLLELARGDLLWRLGAEGYGAVNATTSGVLDTESGEAGQPEGAAAAAFSAAAPLPTAAPPLGDKRGRVRGRERARSRKQETGDLAEYEAASSGGAGPSTALAGRAVAGAPFLAANKRHTEIAKVTRELFTRRDELLFSSRPSALPYCPCLQELCVVLLLWAHRAGSHEVAGLVIASMARHQQSPPLETVAGMFEGEWTAEGRGREGYWAAYLEVFRAIKPAVAHAVLSPVDAEAGGAEGAARQATAVRLLGLGVTASIRAGLPSRAPSAAPVDPAVPSKRKTTSIGTNGSAISSGTVTPSTSGSKQTAAMGFDPSEVYDNLSLLLRAPSFDSPNSLAPASASTAAPSDGRGADSGGGPRGGPAARAGAEAPVGRAAFVSGAVKSIIQTGHLDTALAIFHLTLQRGLALSSRTVELLASQLLQRGGPGDRAISNRMLDLLFQRRHVPTLGTLKSFILAEVVAGEGEGAGGGRGGRGGWDGGAERGEGQRHLDREWSACRRIVDQTRASAARGDSRPQLLTEYVCLLLAEQGIDCPAWAQLD